MKYFGISIEPIELATMKDLADMILSLPDQGAKLSLVKVELTNVTTESLAKLRYLLMARNSPLHLVETKFEYEEES